jgi:hypothetical protein
MCRVRRRARQHREREAKSDPGGIKHTCSVGRHARGPPSDSQ